MNRVKTPWRLWVDVLLFLGRLSEQKSWKKLRLFHALSLRCFWPCIQSFFFRREFSSQVKRWSLFDEKGGGRGIIFEVWLKFFNTSCLVWLRNTVDGRNPAPVDMVNIPGGAGFLPSTAWTTISWCLENLNPSEILKLKIWSHFSSQLVPVAPGMDHPCKPLTTLTYGFDIFWPFTLPKFNIAPEKLPSQ